MHNIGLEEVGSALLITLGMVSVSIIIVGLAMWWLYRFFKTKDETDHTQSDHQDQ